MRAGSTLSSTEPSHEMMSATSPVAARGEKADATLSTTASRSVGSSVRLSVPPVRSLCSHDGRPPPRLPQAMRRPSKQTNSTGCRRPLQRERRERPELRCVFDHARPLRASAEDDLARQLDNGVKGVKTPIRRSERGFGRDWQPVPRMAVEPSAWSPSLRLRRPALCPSCRHAIAERHRAEVP
jgi:hypothetical protein